MSVAERLKTLQTRQGKHFFPRALVDLTFTLETLKDADVGAPRSRFGGAIFESSGVVHVVAKPTRLRIVRNGYQQPDGFEAEFELSAFPLTPKQIRSANVGIFLWGASTIDAAAPVDVRGNLLLKPVFEGIVDEPSSEYTADGLGISLSGQDYTVLFSGPKWDPARRAPAGLRLDTQLEQLIQEKQPSGLITLRVEPESLRASLPIVGSKQIKTNKKGKPVKDKSTWWDVMYEMALQEGYILFVEGTDVVLTQPRVLHDIRAGLALNGRSGPPRPIYSFAWGRNLTRFEVSRGLGKEAQPSIEVVCWNPDSRTRMVGRYPAGGQKASVGIGTEANKIERYVSQGATSEEVLRQQAQNIYEIKARGEQKMAMGTDDLVDLSGNDVLQMRAGDACSLDIDVFKLADLLRADPGTRQAALERIGLPPDTARYIAFNYDAVDQMRGPFRVREVTIEFDGAGDGGLSLDAELQDYVRPPVET